MNFQPTERWEHRLQEIASRLPYPPTPELADPQARLRPARALLRGSTRHIFRRRWAVTLAVILAALALLLSVPAVRAQLLEFIQIGAVRIWLANPTPGSTQAPANLPAHGPSSGPTLASSPAATVDLPLSGATTLAQARQKAGFPLRLPTYPASLGEPAAAYYQNLGGPVVVLVWMDPNDPAKVTLSLQMIGKGSYAVEKFQPPIVAYTQVNGHPAVWTEGPYLLQEKSGEPGLLRLLKGHVLIWKDGDITYRLETSLTVDEAVKIAGSLAEP